MKLSINLGLSEDDNFSKRIRKEIHSPVEKIKKFVCFGFGSELEKKVFPENFPWISLYNLGADLGKPQAKKIT